MLAISADNNLGAAPGAATVGKIVLSGGTLQGTANFTLNANRGITLTGGGTVDVTDAQYDDLAGIIASTGTFAKVDLGSLTAPRGVNTYTGSVLVRPARTTIPGSVASAVTVSGTGQFGGNATLTTAITGTGGSVSPGSIVLQYRHPHRPQPEPQRRRQPATGSRRRHHRRHQL